MIEYWVIQVNLGGDKWRTARYVLDLESAVRQVAHMKEFDRSNGPRKESTYRILNTKTDEVIDDAIIV